MTTDKLASIMRKRGYKMTPQRRAVLEVISSSHDHLTPAGVYERVRRNYPDIGLVTIYRTLDILTELELICRVHAEDGCRSYLARRLNGHHHHIVCSSCGAAIDFVECDLSKLQQRLSERTGFRIQGHLLEFNGLCQGCLRQKLPDASSKNKSNERGKGK